MCDDADDGVDTIGWAAAQPWSSGRVGMFGQSYVGATQWLAAPDAPDALRAIAPAITSADYHASWTYQGGAFQLGFSLLWTLMFLAPSELLRRGAPEELLVRCVTGTDDIGQLYRRTPLHDQPVLGDAAPYYREWLEHAEDDDFWRRIAPVRRVEQVTVPALIIGGWYDLFIGGTLASYRAMRAHGGSDAARRHHRLIVGPWAHGATTGTFIERSYGIGAGLDALDTAALHREWFDTWLTRDGAAAPWGKPVRIFVMGANEWREEDDWPLPGTRYESWFLHSRGSARTLDGDGSLSAEPPSTEPDDTFDYDPRDPVPTVGGATFLPGLWLGANAGPRDQRAVESRPDVLCYTSGPLERPLEVIGHVELILHASSSARDTDFVGKLVDVAPDGRAELLCDGILRARYREDMTSPTPLQPGKVEELRIDLGATVYRFPAGHRIRLDVTSSNFPRFDRNTNTGGVIAREHIDEAIVATNTVHHQRAHPSRLVLPVIDHR